MKNLLLAVLIITGTQAFAQQTIKKESYAPKTKITGYVALTQQYSRFKGRSASFSGAYGGIMINHKLMIGVGGYGLTSRHKGFGLNAETHKENYWRMGYGGLALEYTFLANKNIHFTASTLLGGGIIKNGRGRGTVPENGSDELKDIDASGFYVVQPAVGVEVIAARWMRVGANVGYRYTSGVDHQGISNADMRAPTASLSLKFGFF